MSCISVESMESFISFDKNLENRGLTIDRIPLKTIQINLGKLCNQACHHCHVDAGPTRNEIMERRTVDRLMDLIVRAPSVTTIDLTGGAPELNPYFRDLVRFCRFRGKEIIDRCNLTVLFEKGQEDTAGFLREYRVQIVSSLPCYSQENVDQQRGGGVFDKSIKALKMLNEMGYGQDGTDLILNLVYNSVGISLPPDQKALEKTYKKRLKEDFGIQFNQLFTITNMPINRFLNDLKRQGKENEYMTLLINGFNKQAAQGVMCRDQISISWDGFIYDCDFNQMLSLPVGNRRQSIWDIDSFEDFHSGSITFANHCYGCTAGSGSSCSGALARSKV